MDRQGEAEAVQVRIVLGFHQGGRPFQKQSGDRADHGGKQKPSQRQHRGGAKGIDQRLEPAGPKKRRGMEQHAKSGPKAGESRDRRSQGNPYDGSGGFVAQLPNAFNKFG